MSVGMQLYQPLAWKGRLLKRWFPLISNFDSLGLVRNVLHIEEVECPISVNLATTLQEVFKNKDIEYSVFNGTPCAHQKKTIQVYEGSKILGYCKVSRNSELITLFQREDRYLCWLKACGVSGVPECICCKEIEDGTWIFVQTTVKSNSSTVNYKLNELELNFLKNLSEKTIVKCAFEETEMYQGIKSIDETSMRNDIAVVKGLTAIQDYYHDKENCVFSAYHSDFTPWNMFSEGNELFVFDWEYAGRTYMPYLDLIHFIIQTGIFSGNMNAPKLYNRLFKDNNELLNRHFKNPRIAVLCYLLDVMAKYAKRDEGKETNDTLMLKDNRINLISLIIKEI